MTTFPQALLMTNERKPEATLHREPSVFPGRAWQQVLARDTAADGQFVYAVETTGVYCRPSCPSRKPQRRNVRFFGSPAQAEGAGFRACLRCEPARVTPKPDPQAAAIARAADYLTEHAGQRTPLEDVAAAAGVGRFALQRGFQRVLGLTPAEFARAQRRERFRDKVREPKVSVTKAVYEAGFGSSSRIYEQADQTLGMSPTALKAGGAGERVAMPSRIHRWDGCWSLRRTEVCVRCSSPTPMAKRRQSFASGSHRPSCAATTRPLPKR
jgi:AraC family transcriptional regulator of adaptative response/methylated-DNA-[protein]-cysteine methyltransferase